MFLVSAYASPQLAEESCSAVAAITHYLYLCQFSWMLIQVGTSFPPPTPSYCPVNLHGVFFLSAVLHTEMEMIPYIHNRIPRRSIERKLYKLYNIRNYSELGGMRRNLEGVEIKEWCKMRLVMWGL